MGGGGEGSKIFNKATRTDKKELDRKLTHDPDSKC